MLYQLELEINVFLLKLKKLRQFWGMYIKWCKILDEKVKGLNPLNMQATELRIGNWIYDLAWNEVQVKGTGTNCIWISETGPGVDKAFTQIPLTEEWLIRFGFKNDDNTHYWWHPNQQSLYLFLTDRNELLAEFWDEGEDRFSGISLISLSRPHQYVHQLQNLYFALTGEELNLNP